MHQYFQFSAWNNKVKTRIFFLTGQQSLHQYKLRYITINFVANTESADLLFIFINWSEKDWNYWVIRSWCGFTLKSTTLLCFTLLQTGLQKKILLDASFYSIINAEVKQFLKIYYMVSHSVTSDLGWTDRNMQARICLKMVLKSWGWDV